MTPPNQLQTTRPGGSADPPRPGASPPERARTRDTRIASVHRLVPPAQLRQELTMEPDHEEVVLSGRRKVERVLDSQDPRLLVVVGPCSIHDPAAALDYARGLAALAAELSDQLVVVMRAYFEKPRTTLGWKGLINDPTLDGSFRVNLGLRTARRLLLDILDLGLPVGCEFLDPIIPQYLADAVTWGSIGARTAESQVHRQLASGLSMPIGIKNSTHGDVQAAVDAVSAAAAGHVFTGITDDGQAAIFSTTGNPQCHVVLRGSPSGPNHDRASVAGALDLLSAAGLALRVVVDASHGNSGRDPERQQMVVAELAERVGRGEPGVVGVMLESFLVAGRQDLELGRADKLTYGQSVTDACMGWDQTVGALRQLAEAADRRRRMRAAGV